MIPCTNFTDVDTPNQDTPSHFTLVSLNEIFNIGLDLLDIIPTELLIEVTEIIGPWLLSIFNSSLSLGCVPDCFKTTCVQPFLKAWAFLGFSFHHGGARTYVQRLSALDTGT